MPDAKPLILLVDDEPSLLEVTSIILEGEGFATLTAKSVSVAMEHLASTTPDIIISDITMPEQNGFDFFQQVRSITHLQKIPFIFMTAHSDIESVKNGKEVGADDYLTKPVDVNILLSTIRGKLKRRQMLSEAFTIEIDQMKNRLFRMISHEMRTPLTSILGATEILSESKDNLTPEDFTTFLQMLQASSNRLNRMVEDFLLSMKIESNQIVQEAQLQPYHFNPHTMFDRIMVEYQDTVKKKNILFDNAMPDYSISVVIYQPHLDNILHRLLDNAVKFSNNNGKIIARLGHQNSKYTMIIQDFGVGIPQTKMNDIFQKFSQVNREKTEQQGSGLGLYIANRLSEVNKCQMHFTSEEGKGVTVALEIPEFIPVTKS